MGSRFLSCGRRSLSRRWLLRLRVLGSTTRSYVLQGNSPNTLSVVQQTYLYAFTDLDFGHAVSAAMIGTIASIVVSFVKGCLPRDSVLMLGKLSTGRDLVVDLRNSSGCLVARAYLLGFECQLYHSGWAGEFHCEYRSQSITLSQYGDLLRPWQPLAGGFYLALRNSVIQAGAATVLAAVVALFSGYAFGRWTFFGSKSLFLLVVATLSLPLLAVLLPLFKWTSELHLINTFPPLILLALSASLPLAVWIMRSFVTSLPPDLEGAARIDGASEFRLLRDIVLPRSALQWQRWRSSSS